jgi:hypothetical protein
MITKRAPADYAEALAPAWTGSANDLDTSNLPWNARMSEDGTIIVL